MIGENFGRRKSDNAFVIHVSEEIGRLKEGYEIASKGYQTILSQIAELDRKVDGLKDALYGNGPDNVGIFERIRSLALKVGIILFVLGGIGGFLGRLLEKVMFK